MYKRSTNKFSFIQPNERGKIYGFTFLGIYRIFYHFFQISTIIFKSNGLYFSTSTFIILVYHIEKCGYGIIVTI
jgi:uncharacterized membrane protein YobD (UPF0266 family)